MVKEMEVDLYIHKKKLNGVAIFGMFQGEEINTLLQKEMVYPLNKRVVLQTKQIGA